MRVTFTTFPDTLVNQLSKLTSRQNRLQNQAATGQRITNPSDDPIAVRRVMDLQKETGAVRAHQDNIIRQREQSQTSYEVMRALKTLSDRANEIAIRSDGVKSQTELNVFAEEIGQMLDQAVQLANSKHRGVHLFAGTRNDQSPFERVTDADGVLTGVVYKGNSDVSSVEIAESVTLSVQVPGVNNTDSGSRGLLVDSQSGADLFKHMIALRDLLRAGDTETIREQSVSDLQRDESNFIHQFSNIGAVQARLDAAESVSRTRSLSLEKLVSRETDADLAQTMVRLSEAQTAYRVALQSGAQMLDTSLMDFIR